MRLSYQKQHDIKEAILKNLYSQPIQKIDDKKGALVIRNHSEWIKPLMPIINQLPDGERWNIWKQWIIEYELIGRQDQKACSNVYEGSKNNPNHFWQTARIFCLSINDKVSQAEFILDLLKVKGFEDPIFENLFQIMNNEKEKF